MIDPQLAKKNAKAFANSREPKLKLQDLLGHGQDGEVWSTLESAIKAFFRPEAYYRERNCYLRLKELNKRKIKDFNVPVLMGYSDELLVIEMGIVRPPYILDFGKAYLDTPPPYYRDPQIIASFHADGKELFGESWREVRHALAALEGIGIYYYDPKPANINFGYDTSEDE